MRYFVFFLGICAALTACRTSKLAGKKQLSSADYPYMRTFHAGVRYKLTGRIPEAITAFDSCFRAKPTDDAAAFGLAQSYLLAKDQNNAAIYTEAAAKIDPSNIWYTQELAYMYYNQGKFEQAAKCFEKMVAAQPSNIDWLFGQAEVLKQLNRSEDAIKALDKMEDQLGVVPEITIQKFDLYCAIKQDEKGIKAIEKARETYPDDLSLIGTLVDYYFKKNQIVKAQEMLVALVKADPNNARANLALGDLNMRQGNKKDGYAYFIAAFKGQGIDIDTKMSVLLDLYEHQINIDPEVYELADLMILQDPENAKGYSIKGDLLIKSEKKEEALTVYKKALSLDDTRFPIWNQVLLLEYELGKFEALYFDARACSALFPTISNVQLLYTVACNQTDRYEEALEQADLGKELVVNDNPLLGEFYAQKGEALFSLNKIEDGIEAYKKSLALNGSNALTKNNYAMKLAIANTRLPEALELIDQVIFSNGEAAPFLDTKGFVLFQMKDYKEAKNYFEKALTLSAKDKNYLDHLGDAFAKLGDATKAVELWKEAKSLGAKNKSLDKKIQTKQYVSPVY